MELDGDRLKVKTRMLEIGWREQQIRLERLDSDIKKTSESLRHERKSFKATLNSMRQECRFSSAFAACQVFSAGNPKLLKSKQELTSFSERAKLLSATRQQALVRLHIEHDRCALMSRKIEEAHGLYQSREARFEEDELTDLACQSSVSLPNEVNWAGLNETAGNHEQQAGGQNRAAPQCDFQAPLCREDAGQNALRPRPNVCASLDELLEKLSDLRSYQSPAHSLLCFCYTTKSRNTVQVDLCIDRGLNLRVEIFPQASCSRQTLKADIAAIRRELIASGYRVQTLRIMRAKL